MKFASFIHRKYPNALHRFLMTRLVRPDLVDDLAKRVHTGLFGTDPKKTAARPLESLYDLAAKEVEQSSRDGDVLEAEEAQQLLRHRFDATLHELPPLQAAILLAHKRDGLSYEELEIKFGLAVPVIEKCITDAKARVRVWSWNDESH